MYKIIIYIYCDRYIQNITGKKNIDEIYIILWFTLILMIAGCIFVYMYICLYMCTYVHKHMYICTYTNVPYWATHMYCICLNNIHVCIYTYMYVCIYLCVVYMHIYTHKYIHLYVGMCVWLRIHSLETLKVNTSFTFHKISPLWCHSFVLFFCPKIGTWTKFNSVFFPALYNQTKFDRNRKKRV